MFWSPTHNGHGEAGGEAAPKLGEERADMRAIRALPIAAAAALGVVLAIVDASKASAEAAENAAGVGGGGGGANQAEVIAAAAAAIGEDDRPHGLEIQTDQQSRNIIGSRTQLEEAAGVVLEEEATGEGDDGKDFDGDNGNDGRDDTGAGRNEGVHGRVAGEEESCGNSGGDGGDGSCRLTSQDNQYKVRWCSSRYMRLSSRKKKPDCFL